MGAAEVACLRFSPSGLGSNHGSAEIFFNLNWSWTVEIEIEPISSAQAKDFTNAEH